MNGDGGKERKRKLSNENEHDICIMILTVLHEFLSKYHDGSVDDEMRCEEITKEWTTWVFYVYAVKVPQMR